MHKHRFKKKISINVPHYSHEKILFFLLFILYAIPLHAMSFNNVSFTDKELIDQIERSYATGTNKGFGGFKQYTFFDLCLAYSEFKDPYLYRYIKKDLMALSEGGERYFIEPVSNMSFNAYNYSGNVPNKDRYCLENQEGRCLDRGLNTFFDMTGQARFLNDIALFYEGEIKVSEETKDIRLKKLYSKYKLGHFEFEAGKDSIWLGHATHSSLLLSNNAEPFWLAKLTTDSFRLPFFFRYLGEFKYMLFHGWLDDFNLLGQRIGWKPSRVLEFGFTQTTIYRHGKGYTVWDVPHLFFSSEENVPGAYYNNDQRASMDVALYLPFLDRLPLLKGGKLYAEYGGEDTCAWWQKEDDWEGPIGFEFLSQGIMYGGMLTTGDTDLRVEYSENWRSSPIFDTDAYEGASHSVRSNAWYRKIHFLNNDVLMGHHMGPEADDLFIEMKHRFNKFIVTGFYDRERHKFYKYDGGSPTERLTPEKRQQYGLNLTYPLNSFEIGGMISYVRYENVDTNPDPLVHNISYGQSAKELITGVGIIYLW